MIRIEKIEIEEFRGIRNLSFDFNGRSIGICGPNGSGKSDIVDAIEFALTGNISRLGGRGTSDLSVKAHAPHVDFRDNAHQAVVRLTARAPSLGKSFTIERNVATPQAPKLTPDSKDVRAIVADLALHPEFALSRRDIIKYILTPPGQRAKDVQDLLRIDQIETTRLSIQKIANECKSKVKLALETDERAKRDLVATVHISSLSKKALIEAVNQRRTLLGLDALDDLTPGVSVKAGVAAQAGDIATRLSKTAVMSDVDRAKNLLASASSSELKQQIMQFANSIQELLRSPSELRSFRQIALLRQGLELVDSDSCPLCDTPWDIGALKQHLTDKHKASAKAAEKLAKFDGLSQPIVNLLGDLEAATKLLSSHCLRLDPKSDRTALDGAQLSWKKVRELIGGIIGDASTLHQLPNFLELDTWILLPGFESALASLEQRATALPEPSKEDEAKEYLILVQAKLDHCRSTKLMLEEANQQNSLASKLLEHFEVSSNQVLEDLFISVRDDFVTYYKFINEEDEIGFSGKLVSEPAKLNLSVDFYGRGTFPPGAYHSEGHQDSMGLCLYLALMKKTLGRNFTFAILDDVLMSIDASHRRQVCKLLKKEFPNTQFVLTTHDPVWLQFMRTENLIQGNIAFGGWTVESGPRIWSSDDTWEKIEAQLADNDVPAAAATLRRYLEYSAALIADNLRAAVEYRGNGQYDLGDLLPPSIAKWRATLSKARLAAKSWNQHEADAAVAKLEEHTKSKIAKSSIEQWMINKAVHYVEWANLQPSEFSAVATAFKELLQSMRCANAACGGYFYISPSKGEQEALRCSCGATNFNLTSR